MTRLAEPRRRRPRSPSTVGARALPIWAVCALLLAGAGAGAGALATPVAAAPATPTPPRAPAVPIATPTTAPLGDRPPLDRRPPLPGRRLPPQARLRRRTRVRRPPRCPVSGRLSSNGLGSPSCARGPAERGCRRPRARTAQASGLVAAPGSDRQLPIRHPHRPATRRRCQERPRRARSGLRPDAVVDGARLAHGRPRRRARVVLLDQPARKRRARTGHAGSRVDAQGVDNAVARHRARDRRGHLPLQRPDPPPRRRDARSVRPDARDDGRRALGDRRSRRHGRRRQPAGQPGEPRRARRQRHRRSQSAGSEPSTTVSTRSSTAPSARPGATSSSATSAGATSPANSIPRYATPPARSCSSTQPAQRADRRAGPMPRRWRSPQRRRTAHSFSRCRPTVRDGTRSTRARSSPSLLNTLCGSVDDTACVTATAAEAEFRNQNGTIARIGGLLLIAVGELGMFGFLGFIALRLLSAALLAVLYLLLAPIAVLAPALGDGGRSLFRLWSLRLLGSVIAKLIYSVFLGVVLLMLRVLGELGSLGWWTQWLLIAAFWWIVFDHRHQLLEHVIHERGESGRRASLGSRLFAAHQAARLARPVLKAVGRAARTVDEAARTIPAGPNAERLPRTPSTGRKSELDQQVSRTLERDHAHAVATVAHAHRAGGRARRRSATVETSSGESIEAPQPPATVAGASSLLIRSSALDAEIAAGEAELLRARGRPSAAGEENVRQTGRRPRRRPAQAPGRPARPSGRAATAAGHPARQTTRPARL